MKKVTISIIGGAGHIGLPLGVLFACKNLNVNLIDINSEAIDNISRGKFIYKEEKSKFYLDKALKKKNYHFQKNYLLSKTMILLLFV